MSGQNQRLIYFNDSRTLVREKLNLQDPSNDDVFSQFEDTCKNILKFKTPFHPQSKWDDLDEGVAQAQANVKESLEHRGLTLGVTASHLDALIEWKIYNLHKAAKKRDNRKK